MAKLSSGATFTAQAIPNPVLPHESDKCVIEVHIRGPRGEVVHGYLTEIHAKDFERGLRSGASIQPHPSMTNPSAGGHYLFPNGWTGPTGQVGAFQATKIGFDGYLGSTSSGTVFNGQFVDSVSDSRVSATQADFALAATEIAAALQQLPNCQGPTNSVAP